MRNWWIVSLTLCASTLSLSAQPRDDSAEKSVPGVTPGTGVVAELSKGINAKKAKPGDTVKANVTQDVVDHGQVAIRLGSKLVGHIVEVKAATKEDPQSRLAIVFDKAVLKGGGEMSLVGGIRALASPQQVRSLVDQPDQMMPPRLATSTVQANGSGTAQPLGKTTGSTRTGGTGSATTSADAGAGVQVTTNKVNLPYLSNGVNPNSLPKGGLLSPGSRGVFGLPGLSLASGGGKVPVIISAGQSVKLETGVQVVVLVSGPVAQ